MKPDSRQPRILIAGMGNILRRDDGFGVAVAQRLQAADLPTNVTVVEVGTGGISLVQELMAPPGYEMLVLLDAVQGDGPAGRVVVLDADVPDLDDFPDAVRRDYLADMHYAVPSRALVLAKALGVLPGKTLIVGCHPEAHEAFEIGLSRSVNGAVETAVERVKVLLNDVAGTRAQGSGLE
jgi:hydrogenase maturation protease